MSPARLTPTKYQTVNYNPLFQIHRIVQLARRPLVRPTLLCGLALMAVAAFSLYSPSSAQRRETSMILHLTAASGMLATSPLLLADSIAVFRADCSTSATTFVLGDTVCAEVTGAPQPFFGFRQRRFQWAAPNGTVVRQVDVTTDPQSDTYSIPTSGALAQVGTWTVRTINNSGNTIAVAKFTVRDPANQRVDLSVSKFGPLEVRGGSNVSYTLTLTNRGPDAAQNVQLTDAAPEYMTYVSTAQTSGPLFNCSNTPSGTITCTRSSLAIDATATFIVVYQVDNAAPVGTTIVNTVDVSSSTTELRPADNTASAPASVTGTAGGGGEECVVSCPADRTVVAPANQSGASVTFAAPTSTGGTCGAVSCNRASGDFFPIGTTTVVCAGEAGDPCSFDITVTDEQDPTISCPSNITTSETTVNYPPPSASDNSGEVTVSCDRPSGSSFPAGTTTVTCTATDSSNNTASCSFTVTVEGTGCTLTCPQNITVDSAANACGAVVTYPAPTGSTECGTITSSPASGTFFNVGTTTVNVTSSSEQSCTFTVTVVDSQSPTLTCPADIITAAADGTCSATVDPGTPTATDNCAGVTVSSERDDNLPLNAPFPVGITTITWTATDVAGHTDVCQQTVRVNDNVPPTVTAPAGIVESADASCQAQIPDVSVGLVASDTCSDTESLTVTQNPQAGAVVGLGTHNVTITVTDESGNSATVETTYTVNDTTPPVVALNGEALITVECGMSFTDPGVTATDECDSNVTVTTSGNLDLNVPGTYTITYTASDGTNTATVTREISVVDNTAPVITVTGGSPLTVECHTSFTDPGATAMDACAGNIAVSVSGSVDANVPGSYTLTYTATDGTNTATATRTVNVVDTTAPLITVNGPNPLTVECHTSFVDPGATAEDSCAGSVAVSATNNVDVNVPGTYTVTYTSTDGTNTATETRTVIVVDTTAPTITLTGLAITLWPPNHGYRTINLTQLVAGASDGCDGSVDINDVVISKVTSDESENGGGDGNTFNDIVIAANCKSVQLRAERQGGGNGRVYTITFSVRDASNNVQTATAQVKVPKSPGNNGGAVDDGPAYTVNGTCP